MKEWPTVRFGDIVKKMSGKISLEERTGKFCVRGEHIPRKFPPAVEHIVVADDYLGPAFHRTFEAGDILFATRFPNMNKVGQPSFSGICASTTLVLRADENKLRQDLLPWIMKSADFVSHCILNTRGSTNPYINWTQLAEYKFSLPPPEIQSEIMKLLSVNINLCSVLHSAEPEIMNLFDIIRRKIIRKYSTKKVKLSELINCDYGKPLTSKNRSGTGFPVVSSSGICDMHNEKNVEKSGIVIGRKGSAGNVFWVEGPHFVIDTAYSVTVREGHNPKFVYHLLQTIDIKRLVITTTIPGLNRHDLQNQFTYIPGENEESHIAVLLDQLEQMILQIKTRKDDANLLQLRFIEELL